MRFEYILWKDIIVQSGWTDESDLTDTATIHSAGIYIDEDEYQVRIAVAYGVDGDTVEYNGIIVIPKGCIIQRNKLVRT